MPDEANASGAAAAAAHANATPPEPDVDKDELRSAVAVAGEDATLRATVESLKRTVGHVPSLQAKLDKIEKAVASVDDVKTAYTTLAERFDALLSALPDELITGRAADALRPRATDSNRELLDKISSLEAKIADIGKTPEFEIDPRMEAVRAQWNTATEAVVEYAKRKGVTPEAIIAEEATWKRAYEAHPNDPAAAAVMVAGRVDELAEAAARREDKKEAGAGGADTSRAARRGPLTVAQLRGMSREEIMKIPMEERLAALRGA